MSLWSRIIERISAFAGGSFADLIFSTKRAPERSDGFAMAVVALGAKMAKADGRVTRDEVIAFREVFEIADEDLPHVGRFYDLARQDVAGFDLYAARIARLFDDRTEALETLLEGLFHIAQADKLLHENELEFLREVARIFGVHPSQFEAMHLRNRPGEASPFDILGWRRDSILTGCKAQVSRSKRGVCRKSGSPRSMQPMMRCAACRMPPPHRKDYPRGLGTPAKGSAGNEGPGGPLIAAHSPSTFWNACSVLLRGSTTQKKETLPAA